MPFSLPFPYSLFPAFFALLLPALLRADTLYTTEFENFTVGDDKIVGTDGWLGTSPTTTATPVGGAALRSGIAAETGTTNAHGVPGLGKAGWIGGNTTPVSIQGSNIQVRRSMATAPATFYDPEVANKEVTYITCLLGIKDSTAVIGSPTLRDDFEIFILNGSNQVIAALQFDNTTLTDTFPRAPLQAILRTQGTAGQPGINYTSTGSYFLYDEMQVVGIRINWRTNRWSAFLDSSLIFNDQPFYVGTSARNLGAVGFRMFFGPVQPVLGKLTGGTNYALFDNFQVQADPLPVPAIQSIALLANGNVQLAVPTEAGYRYNLWRSPGLNGGWTSLSTQPSTTSTALQFTDITNGLLPRAFYRFTWVYP